MRGIVVVGLNFGDEGKGALVDSLVQQLGDVSLVCRFNGGCQAAHNVVLEDGRHHCFSQFGAGTLRGIPTYLGPQVIVNGPAIRMEADHLAEVTGWDRRRILNMLTVDPSCLLTTSYTIALNRAREIQRGNGRHGSCGWGIGETRSYWLRYGGDAPRAGDILSEPYFLDKLELQRQRLLEETAAAGGGGDRLADNSPVYRRAHRNPREEAADQREGFLRVMSMTTPPGDPWGTILFEGAQGVLLDERYGFHPWTTWSDCTGRPAHELASAWGVRPLRIIGCTRSYGSRHGAGIFPTEDRTLTATLADPGNPENPWQGSLRLGPLDLPLLRYAKEIVGRIDGLAVSHLDQYGAVGRINTAYTRGLDGSGHYQRVMQRLAEPSWWPTLAAQEELGGYIDASLPVYAEATEQQLLERLAQEIAPVVVEARGRTAGDRRFIGDLWSD